LPDDFATAFNIISLVESCIQNLRLILQEISTFIFIVEHEIKLLSLPNPAKRTLKKTDSIWKEKVFHSERIESSASINHLIIRLTKDQDNTLRDVFLDAYTVFITPQSLLDKLTERYRIPKGHGEESQGPFIQNKVASVLSYWLKKDYSAFDLDLLSSIQTFSYTYLQNSYSDLHRQITQELENEGHFYVKHVNAYPSVIQLWQPIQIPINQVLLACNGRTIAEQLTLIDIEIFKRLERTEILGSKWVKDKSNLLTPFIRALLDRHNQISSWVQSWILLQSNVSDRKKVVKKLFNIAKSLLELHNYYTLTAVFAGLNSPAIIDLQYIWSSLGKKTAELLDLNKKLSDPNKSYQELIKLKDYNKNTLPLLTSCLRELRNIEELPDFVKVNQDDKEVLLVNIKKHMMITDLINSLFQYQKIDIEKKRTDL